MSKEKNKKTAEKVQKPPKVAKQKAEKVQKPPKVSKKKARTPITKKKKAVIAVVTVLITAALAAGLGLGFGMPKTRKVTFVFGDGAESIVKTAKSGTLLSALIGQLPAPETGYEYVVTDGSGAEVTGKIPDKDISLTVTVRAKKYSLTVDTGEGAAKVTEVVYGSPLTLPQTPAKRGHTFAGWKDGSGNAVTAATLMPAGDLTVKAAWTVNKYLIKADIDGTVTTVEWAYGSEIKLTKPVKTGYTFAGWTGMPSDGKMPDKELNLTAQWTVKQYALTFNFNDNGVTESTVAQKDYGTALVAPIDPTRTGYTFAGWDKALPDAMPDRDLTLTAQWTANPYDLTFDTNGGEIIASYTVGYETALGELPTPIKTGYTFVNWIKTGTDEEVTAATLMPLDGLNLQAVWTINQHTLTFNFNDNGVTESTVALTDYGTALVAPIDPTRTGYTFAGWDTTLPDTMPDSDLTLTAQWTANPYDLTFDTNGGEIIDSYTVGYETALGELPTPIKTGYTFVNWVRYGTSEEVTAATLMPLDGLSIQAIWTVTPYTLTFNTDGGNVIDSRNVNYDTALGELEEPTREGQVFRRWVIEGTETEVTADMRMPAGDLTVKAQWYALSNLTFTPLGSTAYSVKMSTAGSSAQVPDVVIPSTYEGKPVTTIGDSAFRSGADFIKSIRIPSGVTSIEASAFWGCNKITTVTIPHGVKSIGTNAFRECSALTTIEIPPTVTTFGSSVFNLCIKLTSATFPEGVTSIGQYMFVTGSSLTSVIIPKSVKAIDNNAFNGCSILKKIYYTGTPSDKNGITIHTESNGPLLSATWYYYSNEKPSDTTRKYWHYDTDGVTVVEW